MQTIIFNRKPLRVSATDHRFLLILRSQDFAARRSDFEEGRGNYRSSILPPTDSLAQLGATEKYASAPLSTREARFFKAHPRCKTAIFGNPRRVNAILNKLQGRAGSRL